MRIFEPIYTTILKWAKHKHAERYLAGVSFAESSFFPIPVDVMLAPMVLAAPNRAWRLAAITTVMSVLGGLFGYIIGAYFFDLYGTAILDYFNAHATFDGVQASYLKYGMLIVLVAGFTPVPYKIFTIASGVIGIAVVPFLFMSLISRGARFFLVAGLIKMGGSKLEETLHKKVELIGWVVLLLIVFAVVLYTSLPAS
ncbi:MAG: DedA family protein [Arenicella sp.]|jgi:membrane protein YqaA with SNARE-associated domain|nr:DedA family protein [Arenicella sp.]